MLTKTILKKALNVKHTAIDNVTFGSDDSIIVRVHPTKGEQCRCGKCGRKAPRYDAGSGIRRWRTCDMDTHKTYLESEVYRVNCPEHGVVACAVPWARHDSAFTYEFEHMTAWVAVHCSRKVTAEFMRISWNTVGPIISRIRQDADFDQKSRFDGLVNIGVDETSYKKGHKYITVIVNHDTGKVIRGYAKARYHSEGHQIQ
ncbi:transposase family protein [Hornefia butyriciproducens]|uniref:Transposase n=1 Tax=Hornefia butyriciproducens TaxID=2652293 RepID=A0A6L5Y756_9FIRM|nr:transposase family protein [Hornefia butyriciproducens]MST51697.1 transposase [Hornefia butyriciproducens]